MTLIAAQITPDEVRIFTDRLSSSLRGNIKRDYYKANILECGVLFGRGSVLTLRVIKEKLKAIEPYGGHVFDVAIKWLPLAARQSSLDFIDHFINSDEMQSSREFVERKNDAIPSSDPEEILKLIQSKDEPVAESLRDAFSIDVFLAGFSEKHGLYGLASCSTPNNFELEESYEKNYCYFVAKEPIDMFSKKLGRLPKTKKEMVAAFRFMHSYCQVVEDVIGGPYCVSGGNIDCTILRDGEVFVEDMGPIERKRKKKTSKRGRRKLGK